MINLQENNFSPKLRISSCQCKEGHYKIKDIENENLIVFLNPY